MDVVLSIVFALFLLALLVGVPLWGVRTVIRTVLRLGSRKKRRLQWHVQALSHKIQAVQAIQPEHQEEREQLLQALPTESVQTVEAIVPVLTALQREQSYVSTEAMAILHSLCPQVRTVVFGSDMMGVSSPRQTLWNPNVTALTIPFSNLRKVVIDAATAQHDHLEAFLRYVTTVLEPHHVLNRISIAILNESGRFPLTFWNPLGACRHLSMEFVRTSIVIFGTLSNLVQSAGVIQHNPDMAEVRLPMPRLQEIHIAPQTANMIALERFLTYALNSVGQTRLKRVVMVYIHGHSAQLPHHIRNSLTNLCRGVVIAPDKEQAVFSNRKEG
jgi:hypothetical protein